jgi:aspartate/methionine/tyrosine aminotransferase
VKIEPFKLERWMTSYETNVRYDIADSGIFRMTAGELVELVPESARAEALNDLLATPLGYSEARGTEALRAELARTYRDLSPDDILVTTGAIEANFVLLNTLLEPGDHVVAVDPAYQQLQSVPRAIGCEVALWRLRPENGFRYDLDELERLVTPRTKLIVINTPHNPTGAVLTADELRRIYDLAERLDARVLCDEAYRWLELPGGEPIPAPMRDLGPRAISVGTLSKPFGLPGVRIGWIAAPDDVAHRC